MLGGADNPNGELPSYITGANNTASGFNWLSSAENHNRNVVMPAIATRFWRRWSQQHVSTHCARPVNKAPTAK